MDVLEELTRELRDGDDRDRPNESDGRTTADPSTDRRESGRRETDGGRDRDARGRDARDRDARGREEEHVCSFCATEFDAGRRTCPDCGAEVVLRGAR